MHDLIKLFKNDDGSVAVDGRDLHKFLEVETPYTQWFNRMIEYGFVENVDFVGLSQKSEKPFGGRPTVDHAMTLDMAKEISMIQRTEKGKQARQYFIEMEKQARQPKLPETPEEKITLLLQNGKHANERLTKVEDQVKNLEDNQSLKPGEYNYINKCVGKAVNEYIVAHHLSLNTKQRGLLYKDISRGLNEVTGVRTRTQLRQENFDTADEFIQNWTPSTATIQLIRQAELSGIDA